MKHSNNKALKDKFVLNIEQCEVIEKFVPKAKRLKKKRKKKYKKVKVKKCVVREKNAFYGKKHAEVTKKIMRKKRIKKITSVGYVNPMAGTNLYNIWVKKYGVEEADIKYAEYKDKFYELNGGTNHPMYGKIAGRSTGSGWKGTYKGMYFRSVRELSFLVNYIEHFGLSAVLVTVEHGIEWKDKYDNVRVYYADYVINERYLVEICCDDKRLYRQKDWLLKKKCAEEWCVSKGMEYKMVVPIKISYSQIKMLLDTYKLKWADESTERKYAEYLVKGVHKEIANV